MPQFDTLPKPDAETLRRTEELLREKLAELGVDPAALEAHEISRDMHCAVYPDGSLCYSWKGEPLLAVVPGQSDKRTVGRTDGESGTKPTWHFCAWDGETPHC